MLRAAKAQIVEMLVGIPSYLLFRPDVYGAGFEHDKTLGYSPLPGGTRRFNIISPRADTYPQATGTTSRHTLNDLDIVIDYLAMADAYTLDDVIWSDYESIREYALLDPSTWDRPTSTIVTTVLDGRAISADTEPLTDEQGRLVARRLTIRIPLVHQGSST